MRNPPTHTRTGVSKKHGVMSSIFLAPLKCARACGRRLRGNTGQPVLSASSSTVPPNGILGAGGGNSEELVEVGRSSFCRP